MIDKVIKIVYDSFENYVFLSFWAFCPVIFIVKKENRTLNQIKIPELKRRYNSILHKNFREFLNYIAAEHKDLTAFIIKHKNKTEVTYEKVTFEGFRNDVIAVGTAMAERGWTGKRIAVVGKNSYDWMVTYFATLCGLGTSVPLDKDLPYEELESSLARSYADILVFDKSHAELVKRLQAEGNTQVHDFICMTELEGYDDLNKLRAEGNTASSEAVDRYMNLPIDEHAITILLFTSGTTSMAKAVMLSQYNILANIEALMATEEILPGDVNMAFLPYHHTFGSTGQVLMLNCGVTTTYCDGLKYLQKNIVEYKVSVFFCVPLLIESIYKKINMTIKKEGLEKKVAFGMKLSKFLLKFGIDIRRKVFKSVIDQLGGNLRFVISGASAIDPEAIEGFNNFGIRAVQGFGMTEAAPVITAENQFERRTGSIGHAMPGVDVRIDNPNEDGIGEIIARGPNVMAGYFENEEETAKTLEDGWLHTGDLAYADKDGYLYICGRKKNVVVLKNGKNVYPEENEVLISNLPYVVENFVFGEPKRKDGDPKDLALCAKIVYDPAYMKENFGAETVDAVEKVIRADIDKINETLPSYKQMMRIIVTDQPMIKTTTGKVKRYEETKNM